jgi:molybdenum cofactor cytidylyltransferase
MISAIVLAAGEAKRFGTCKQLVTLRGKPILQHVIDTLLQSDVDDIVVVLGSNAGEIRGRVHFDRARVVENPDYASGMSSSIQTGLRAIDGDAALIVLADQPFVLPQTIDALTDAYRRSPSLITIPVFDGARGNPVLIDRTLFTEMMSVRGDTGFRAIFGAHAGSIRELPVDDRGVVTDIDTRDDYELAERS